MDMQQLIQKHWPTRHRVDSMRALADLCYKLRFALGCSYGVIIGIFQDSIPDLDIGEYDAFMMTLDDRGF